MCNVTCVGYVTRVIRQIKITYLLTYLLNKIKFTLVNAAMCLLSRTYGETSELPSISAERWYPYMQPAVVRCPSVRPFVRPSVCPAVRYVTFSVLCQKRVTISSSIIKTFQTVVAARFEMHAKALTKLLKSPYLHLATSEM